MTARGLIKVADAEQAILSMGFQWRKGSSIVILDKGLASIIP
jgi:hypothetical protein